MTPHRCQTALEDRSSLSSMAQFFSLKGTTMKSKMVVASIGSSVMASLKRNAPEYGCKVSKGSLPDSGATGVVVTGKKQEELVMFCTIPNIIFREKDVMYVLG